MSIIKNIFQNFRKPKNSFMGRCIVKMMNQGHNRISLWCIDNFVKLSGGETVLDIGCGGGQNVANFIKRTHGLVCGMDYSPTCVDIASRKNKAAISQGRASIVEANVSNIPFDDNRFDIVTAFETIYFWNDIVENFKFNPQTMELTGEIDLSSYAAPGLAVPMFGSPFVHNGRLYVTLNQTDMTFQPATEPQIELAVINTQTDKVERVIYEKASGIGIGAYTYGQQTFIDEKGDMYLMCTGAYGMNPKYKTGILRIKKGETEFDPTYNWVLNDQTIEGESGKTVWLLQSQYAGNGKMYATMDIPSYWANPTSPNWFTDKSLISVEMDIYNKTVKKLPIPMTSSFGGAVEKYKNLIVFAINGRNDVGFYTHNPATGETSSDAVVKVDGAPAYFHWFEN